MASSSSSSSDAVKQAQKCALRVSVDCEGCRKKVTKIVNSIDGVESCEVDIKQQKVVVTGNNVDVGVLLKTLVKKTGKHAELWPEDRTIHKTKKKKKKKVVVREDEDEESQSGQENRTEEQRVSNCEEELKRDSETGQREEHKAEIGLDSPPAAAVHVEAGETNKSKGQSGNEKIHIRVESPPHPPPQISNIPPRHQYQVNGHTSFTQQTPNYIPPRHPSMSMSFPVNNSTSTTYARYSQLQYNQVNGQTSSTPPLPNHVTPRHHISSTSFPANKTAATTSSRYSQPEPVYTVSYSAAPQVQLPHHYSHPRPSYFYPQPQQQPNYTMSYSMSQRPQTSYGYNNGSVGQSQRPYRSYVDEVDYDSYGYRQQQQPEPFGMFSDENPNACSIV